jgi:hypothetical protein
VGRSFPEVALHNVFSLGRRQKIRRLCESTMRRGAHMSTIGTVVFWLAVFWMPSVVLMGYLLLPRLAKND